MRSTRAGKLRAKTLTVLQVVFVDVRGCIYLDWCARVLSIPDLRIGDVASYEYNVTLMEGLYFLETILEVQSVGGCLAHACPQPESSH